MTDTYDLSRDFVESQRLDYQHKIWLQNLSYDLHPSLITSLPQGARIADVGTGTGVWLFSIRSSLPSDVELYGFDISDAQFPPASILPSNLSFHTANATEPFPAQLHGTFDIVHLRLLVCALEKDDWPKVARNVLQLLKPGGFVQWDEASFVSNGAAYRSGPASLGNLGATRPVGSGTKALSKIFQHTVKLQVHKMSYGWSTLGETLPQAGFRDVDVEAVASDRVPETRQDFSRVCTRACKAILASCADKKLPGAPDLDEVESIADAALKEIDDGAYIAVDLWVWIGRKPFNYGIKAKL